MNKLERKMFRRQWASYDITSCIMPPAPAKGDRTSTPGRRVRHATNSLATRFIPSRSGVTSAKAAVDVADRRPAGRREAAVDGANQLVHLLLEILVLAHVGAAGHGHLEQDYALQVLGVVGEEPLVRFESVD